MSTATRTESQQQAQPAAPDVRQIVGFSFYRIDQDWRRLPKATKKTHCDELLAVVNASGKQLMVRTYSLVGLKGSAEILIWRVGKTLDELQAMSASVRQTALAGYLTMPINYISMTKRSTYVDKLDPDHQDKRRFITPANSQYLFVYPFVKTREWYLLPFEERQAMMDEHIAVGNKFPSVRLHTTYSFGMDDQEFIVAFETDKPQDFLDLVMALRETKGSKYTLRDTPIYTCISKPFAEILKDIGG